MQQSKWAKVLNDQERLFVSLADGMHNTMLQLALLSEQAAHANSSDAEPAQWHMVTDLSRASLQLLESYTLTMRLQGGTAEPELEPVAMTSLLHETLRILEPYAKQLQVKLELDLPGRLEPVVSDRSILQSALVSLGQVFITAQSQTEHALTEPLRLSVHRGRYGIVAGWYSEGLQLTAQALARARRLGGWAQQPYSELVSGPATGVFIAESLLSSVSGRLHVARYHKATGLAATLPACQQLQLV